MENEIIIAPASPADVPRICELLGANSLPTDGVDQHWKTFIVAREGEQIIGCGGAEAFQFAALIRSVAVEPSHRKSGVGRRIVRQLLDRLASRGLREFYLLTNGAEEYFRRRGFRTIDRDEVHPQILASSQFQTDTCDSATCMRLVMLG